MIVYASRTGTRRNLTAMRQAGYRLLVSRAGVWRTEGFAWAGDNGAWSDYQAGRDFDEDAYERFLLWCVLQPAPDWLVLPDIVAGGLDSLRLSLRYVNRCLSVAPLVLIAVQDGMTARDVEHLVGPSVGVFLGGSTEWKVQTMAQWGEFCAASGCHYHAARINTRARMRQAIAAGAHSVDGSSATRYSVNAPKIAGWAKQPDLLAPRTGARSSAAFAGGVRKP